MIRTWIARHLEGVLEHFLARWEMVLNNSHYYILEIDTFYLISKLLYVV
jgi:hypothetical protein